LEDGEVLEIGTHEELVASGGRYRDMVMLQMDQGMQASR